MPTAELLRQQPPSRRAQLEIALAQAQQAPAFGDLGLPPLRVGARVPTDVLEHIVALHTELRRQRVKPTATPEEAREANADLRAMMRERGNYFAPIERAAAEALDGGRLPGRPAVPGPAALGGQPPRVRRPVRARPAALRAVRDRPAEPADLPQAGVHGHALAAHGAAADPGPLRARPLRAAGLRGLPAPAGGGELLRGRGADARAARGPVPGRRQGRPRPVRGGPARRVRGVLRDGRAPVHEPGHPPPRPALPLREERRGRHHLQGVRERRGGLPGRRGRRDRGPADVPGMVRAAGVRRGGPVQPAVPVLRHAVGHLLVRGRGRPGPGARLRDHARRPVRAFPLVPRPGDRRDG